MLFSAYFFSVVVCADKISPFLGYCTQINAIHGNTDFADDVVSGESIKVVYCKYKGLVSNFIVLCLNKKKTYVTERKVLNV